MDDDGLLREAAADCGDVFLNGEVPRSTPPAMRQIEDFIDGECRRFRSYLRGYITERVDQGDYVGADDGGTE